MRCSSRALGAADVPHPKLNVLAASVPVVWLSVAVRSQISWCLLLGVASPAAGWRQGSVRLRDVSCFRWSAPWESVVPDTCGTLAAQRRQVFSPPYPVRTESRVFDHAAVRAGKEAHSGPYSLWPSRSESFAGGCTSVRAARAL